MTDLQKLIADARSNVAPYRADRDAGKYVPGIGLIFDVERLANALEALNRENEKLQGKLQEVREVCSSDWINLANSTEQFLAANYGLVVRTEDVIDAVDGDEPIETPIYFKAYIDMLAERNALREKVARVRRYAEDRAAYGRVGRTVGSARIASDLFGIVGPSDE